MPRQLRRISIRQGQETVVTYPAPGTLNIITDLKGYGSLYRLNDDESQTWIHNLPDGGSSKVNVVMQPGAYRLIFRTKTAIGSKFTDVIDAFDDALGSVLKDIVMFTLTAPSA